MMACFVPARQCSIISMFLLSFKETPTCVTLGSNTGQRRGNEYSVGDKTTTPFILR